MVLSAHSLSASDDFSSPHAYSRLLLSHPVLELEYSILCRQLKRGADKPIEDKYIFEALKLADKLQYLYQYYLGMPHEADKLRRHQAIYKAWLRQEGYKLPSDEEDQCSETVPDSWTQIIRDATASHNWDRLFSTRSKRVLDFINALETGSQSFRNFVLFMDKYTTTFFTYLAWCYFIPRLAINFIKIARHTIPGFWMQEEERSVDWHLRLYAQLQRCWFELGNDNVWIATGVLTCFLLTGTLAPVGFSITMIAYAFDVVNTGLRAYIELSRLYQLREKYVKRGESMEQRLAALDERLVFEKKRLALSTAVAALTFAAMWLLIPGLAVNPVIPLIGAVLLVAILALAFVLTKKLEQTRPDDTIKEDSDLRKQSFFPPASSNEDFPAKPLAFSLL